MRSPISLFRRVAAAGFILASAVIPARAQQGLPGFGGGLPIQGLDPELQRLLQDELARAFGQPFPGGANLEWGGMALQKPAAVLLDQLNLPGDQGLVVAKVDGGSKAAQAGLKTHDLLLKINGKPVPGDSKAFLKMVTALKADTPVDLVVLRKGKEQAIKAARLPQAALANPAMRPFGGGGFGGGGLGGGGFGGFGGGGFPGGAPAFPPLKFPPVFPGGVPGTSPMPPQDKNVNVQMLINGAALSLNRTGNQFTADHDKDGVKVTVVGTVEGGKARADEIIIRSGSEKKTYAKAEEVPAAYRDRIDQLLQLGAGGGLRVLGVPNLPGPANKD